MLVVGTALPVVGLTYGLVDVGVKYLSKEKKSLTDRISEWADDETDWEGQSLKCEYCPW